VPLKCDPAGVGRNDDYFRVSSQGVDTAIAELASKQHGNVTRRQLLALGLDDSAIAYRVKVGRLHRVYRGVYAVGRRPVSPDDWASAAVLACGPGAALSHGSAMTLWGYWKRWDQPFEVTVLGDRRTKGVVVHRSSTLNRRDLTTHVGIRVTSPARTVFDVSPRLDDKALKRALNTALHSQWCSESQLAELLTRLAHLQQARRIAPLVGLPGTPTRSGWEDEFPEFCQDHGLPAPVMGAVVEGYVVDALFPEHRVIVELDSWEFHRDAIAFQTDRERDAETLAKGFNTVRITWERIRGGPQKEADRLKSILLAQAPKAA
jgi:predicted transcriptional regulator of viral defense system